MLRRQRNYDGALTQLASMRAFLREACRESCPATATGDQALIPLELALTEAASNIILHGSGDQPHSTIVLTVEVSDDQVGVILSYTGEPFDPGTAPEPVFDGSRESGFGLYLIRKCVDEVHYGQDEEGQCVIHLIRKWNQSHSGADHASHD
jgi:anti-sigma regulatory factor (Ser/Thr protein kinase)